MDNLLFRGASIDEFNFGRTMKSGTGIKLTTSIKYSVRCVAEKHLLLGDAIITISDAGDEGLFRMKFHHLGTFSYEGEIESDEERRRLHVETAHLLQPLWNQTVAMFCAVAGIPPVLLPPYRVSEEQIRMGGDHA